MAEGVLAAALLFGVLALILCRAPVRIVPSALALAPAVALAVALAGVPADWRPAMFVGAWISIAVTALTIHLPRGIDRWLALLLAANAGLWSGAVLSSAGTSTRLALALPALLLVLPAILLERRGLGIAVKVVASWAVAVALLAVTLPLTTPTPGYAPDHRD